ncbi:MAG: hypothetical protein LBO05_14275 [Deltaproteobacteria bacterium]|nr:hypothetical protein [Deltaproteobacteria bacterium]
MRAAGVGRPDEKNVKIERNDDDGGGGGGGGDGDSDSDGDGDHDDYDVCDDDDDDDGGDNSWQSRYSLDKLKNYCFSPGLTLGE